MAKKQNKPTKESLEIEESNEVLTEVKPSKDKAKEKKENAKAKKKAKAEKKPKRNRIKEVFSELKKVSWPKFSQACKQTGTVLVVVAVFMVVVLGIDLLLSWLMSLVV